MSTAITILLTVLMVGVVLVAVVPLAYAIAIDNPQRRPDPSAHRRKSLTRARGRRSRGLRPADTIA